MGWVVEATHIGARHWGHASPGRDGTTIAGIGTAALIVVEVIGRNPHRGEDQHCDDTQDPQEILSNFPHGTDIKALTPRQDLIGHVTPNREALLG